MDNIGKYLIAGSLIGLGAFWYLAKSKSCNDSVIGGETSEYECMLKEAMAIGCEWDGNNCVPSNGNGIKCSDITNQSECINEGCYWCEQGGNAWCQGTPCTGELCNALPAPSTTPYPDNFVVCDAFNNKCKMDLAQDVWLNIESNCSNCEDQHSSCYLTRDTNTTACSGKIVPEGETQWFECPKQYYPLGCGCGAGINIPPPFHCSSENEVIWKADNFEYGLHRSDASPKPDISNWSDELKVLIAHAEQHSGNHKVYYFNMSKIPVGGNPLGSQIFRTMRGDTGPFRIWWNYQSFDNGTIIWAVYKDHCEWLTHEHWNCLFGCDPYHEYGPVYSTGTEMEWLVVVQNKDTGVPQMELIEFITDY